MKIVFSKHALLQVKKRNLDKTKILETIVNPDFIQPSYNFRESRFKLYSKNHIKVVVISDSIKLSMKINYDRDVDAVSFTLRKGVVSRTVEISPEIMMDYDVDGNPLYLEILGASDKLSKKDLSYVTIGSVQVPFAIPA